MELKRTIIFILLIVGVVCSDDLLPIPDVDNAKPPTKNEGGIISTLVLVYTKTRESVKFAYDEIQYFRKFKRDLDNVGNWFRKTAEQVQKTYDVGCRIWNEPTNVLVNLKRMEIIFDNTDDLIWNKPRELDRLIATAENSWDKFADGLLVPHTEQTLDYLEGIMGTRDKNDAEYDLIKTTIHLTAEAMAESEMYEKWSEKQLENIQKLDSMYSTKTGVLETDLASLWYTIENANSRNKALKHQASELTLLTASLGWKLHDMSEKVGNERTTITGIRDFRMAMSNNPHREEMLKKIKNEMGK